MSLDGAAATRAAGLVRPPGTDGLWTFLFIDMVIFLMIFFMFMSERLGHVDLYIASQTHLNELFGLANALILLTSSWMVVEAIHAARRGNGRLFSAGVRRAARARWRDVRGGGAGSRKRREGHCQRGAVVGTAVSDRHGVRVIPRRTVVKQITAPAAKPNGPIHPANRPCSSAR